MKPLRIIVTGGAGFIGSHLVDRLIQLGHKVTVIDNFSTGKKGYVNKNAKLIRADLSKPITLPKSEIIFHYAALPRIERSFDHPLLTHRANVTATLHVLQEAVRLKVKRFIYASSSSVYGKIKKQDLPVKESHPCNPQSPYAAQKLMSEIYCQLFNRQHNLDVIILRYFNVYGPRQPTTGAYKLVIPIFLGQKAKGQLLTIYGDGKQTRDFTFISDAVDAAIAALKSKKNFKAEIFNIGSGKPISLLQVADLISRKKQFITPNPRSSWEEKYKYADISKAKKILNFKPKVHLKSGLKQLKTKV